MLAHRSVKSDSKGIFSRRVVIVYGVGAALTGLGSILFHYIGGDSIPTVRLVWALIRGAMTWPLLFGLQVVLQWAIRKGVRRDADCSLAKELALTNCPMAVLLIAMLVGRYLATTPRSTFAKIVMKPIPESPQNVER